MFNSSIDLCLNNVYYSSRENLIVILIVRKKSMEWWHYTILLEKWIHSSFINSSGMNNSGIWKSQCAPISLKRLCISCYRARKHFISQNNTVFSLVRLIMWLLRTNKSTILLWRRKYIQALGNTVFYLVIRVNKDLLGTEGFLAESLN